MRKLERGNSARERRCSLLFIDRVFALAQDDGCTNTISYFPVRNRKPAGSGGRQWKLIRADAG
jgi:hypothetical protein